MTPKLAKADVDPKLPEGSGTALIVVYFRGYSEILWILLSQDASLYVKYKKQLRNSFEDPVR